MDALRLIGGDKAPVEIHLLHDLGGGTERHFQELAEEKTAQGFKMVVMRSCSQSKGRVSLNLPKPIFLPNLESLDLERDYVEVLNVLRLLAPCRIHIHQVFGYRKGILKILTRLARALNAELAYTLHDYHPICPRINFVNETGVYCGEPNTRVCQGCINKNGSFFGIVDILRWRWEFYLFFRGCSQLIVPDEDVAIRCNRYFPDLHFEIRPHRFENLGIENAPTPTKGKVAILGAIFPHKGYDLIRECALESHRSNLGTHYAVIGYTCNDPEIESCGVTVTGAYQEDQVWALLKREAPQAIFLTSLCPETFSYTLSTALQTGLPIIAFDLGAIGRRVRERGRPTDLLLSVDLMREPKIVARQISVFLDKLGQPSD
jgi:glycosyltransferase involved in cell wall biosynthesis